MSTSATIIIGTSSVVNLVVDAAGSDLNLVLIVVEGAAFVSIVVRLFLRVHGEGIVEVGVVRAVDQILSEGMIALVALTFPSLE